MDSRSKFAIFPQTTTRGHHSCFLLVCLDPENNPKEEAPSKTNKEQKVIVLFPPDIFILIPSSSD